MPFLNVFDSFVAGPGIEPPGLNRGPHDYESCALTS